MTLQGSQDIGQRWPNSTEPCILECPVRQLQAPKIQRFVQEVLQCWNFKWLLFQKPRTRRGSSSEVPRNPLQALKLTALYFRGVVVEPSWKTSHAVNTCKLAIIGGMQRKKVPEVCKSKFHEKLREMSKGIARTNSLQEVQPPTWSTACSQPVCPFADNTLRTDIQVKTCWLHWYLPCLYISFFLQIVGSSSQPSEQPAASKKPSRMSLHLHHFLWQPLRRHGWRWISSRALLRRQKRLQWLMLHLRITCDFTET